MIRLRVSAGYLLYSVQKGTPAHRLKSGIFLAQPQRHYRHDCCSWIFSKIRVAFHDTRSEHNVRFLRPSSARCIRGHATTRDNRELERILVV
eukprot:6201407-Pyramimonas_sp.AAC.1